MTSIKVRCHGGDELWALQDPYACRIGWARVVTGSQRRVGSHDGSPHDDLLLLVLKKPDPEWRRTDATTAGDDGFSNGGAPAPRFPAIPQSHLQNKRFSNRYMAIVTLISTPIRSRSMSISSQIGEAWRRAANRGRCARSAATAWARRNFCGLTMCHPCSCSSASLKPRPALSEDQVQVPQGSILEGGCITCT